MSKPALALSAHVSRRGRTRVKRQLSLAQAWRAVRNNKLSGAARKAALKAWLDRQDKS